MSGDLTLAAALTGPDGDHRTWFLATVARIWANGTVTVTIPGRGDATAWVSRSYAPRAGDVVVVVPQVPGDLRQLLVTNPVRDTNPTTADILTQLRVSYDVTAAPAPGGSSGTTAVASTSTGSWRAGTGWSRTAPHQGADSLRDGAWRGCYFPGTGWDTVRGVRVTSCQVTLHRSATPHGDHGPVPMRLQRHLHREQPAGSPIPVGEVMTVGTLTLGSTGTFTLPAAWGQSLVDGSAGGLMHTSDTAPEYAVLAGTEATTTGQVTITWEVP